MSLPSYNRDQRRKQFKTLPKGAYVVRILNAEEVENDKVHKLVFSFDIAEGEYKGFYKQIYEQNKNEDKKWPVDGKYDLFIPGENDPEWKWINYNSFFADLEDSNSGFVWDMQDLTKLRNKVIGGKFRIREEEYNGKEYSHTELKWTCVADDVRTGNYGQLPKDDLLKGNSNSINKSEPNEFMKIPDDAENPFDFNAVF